MNTPIYPNRRLKRGAAILTAAEVVNARAIQKRLSAFADAHRGYTSAQRAVAGAETALRTAQARLEACDAEQDAAVEALARALVADGQPRTNPFAAFGGASPSTIRQMPYAEETRALRALAATVQADRAVSAAARRIAAAADGVARKMEKELAPIEKLRAILRTARTTRDHIGTRWDLSLAALKRSARAAADDGAPDLYAKLFDCETRTVKKKPTAPEEPAAPPAAEAHPEPAQ